MSILILKKAYNDQILVVLETHRLFLCKPNIIYKTEAAQSIIDLNCMGHQFAAPSIEAFIISNVEIVQIPIIIYLPFIKKL